MEKLFVLIVLLLAALAAGLTGRWPNTPEAKKASSDNGDLSGVGSLIEGQVNNPSWRYGASDISIAQDTVVIASIPTRTPKPRLETVNIDFMAVGNSVGTMEGMKNVNLILASVALGIAGVGLDGSGCS